MQQLKALSNSLKVLSLNSWILLWYKLPFPHFLLRILFYFLCCFFVEFKAYTITMLSHWEYVYQKLRCLNLCNLFIIDECSIIAFVRDLHGGEQMGKRREGSRNLVVQRKFVDILIKQLSSTYYLTLVFLEPLNNQTSLV